MGKFRQISTELWPLIYVKILFPGSILSLGSILSIYRPIFFKLCIGVTGRSGLGLKMGKFRQISTELWPMNYIKILFPASVLCIYQPIFFQLCIKVQIRK